MKAIYEFKILTLNPVATISQILLASSILEKLFQIQYPGFLQRIENNECSLDNTCISCWISDGAKSSHPFFEGGVCGLCRVNIMCFPNIFTELQNLDDCS